MILNETMRSLLANAVLVVFLFLRVIIINNNLRNIGILSIPLFLSFILLYILELRDSKIFIFTRIVILFFRQVIILIILLRFKHHNRWSAILSLCFLSDLDNYILSICEIIIILLIYLCFTI